MALIGTNGQGIGTSPLAMWVTAVLEIAMSNDERQQLDLFIDKLYEYVEQGEAFCNILKSTGGVVVVI